MTIQIYCIVYGYAGK